jgi:hypothetical protein
VIVLTNACKRGDHHECQGCNGCDCHGGGMPAGFRERVARLAAAAREESAAERPVVGASEPEDAPVGTPGPRDAYEAQGGEQA